MLYTSIDAELKKRSNVSTSDKEFWIEKEERKGKKEEEPSALKTVHEKVTTERSTRAADISSHETGRGRAFKSFRRERAMVLIK